MEDNKYELLKECITKLYYYAAEKEQEAERYKKMNEELKTRYEDLQKKFGDIGERMTRLETIPSSLDSLAAKVLSAVSDEQRKNLNRSIVKGVKAETDKLSDKIENINSAVAEQELKRIFSDAADELYNRLKEILPRAAENENRHPDGETEPEEVEIDSVSENDEASDNAETNDKPSEETEEKNDAAVNNEVEVQPEAENETNNEAGVQPEAESCGDIDSGSDGEEQEGSADEASDNAKEFD